MRGGIVKCKVKNIRTKSITIEDFSGQKFEKAVIEKIDAIYSYTEGGIIHFLNAEDYSDISINAEDFSSELKYLEDGAEVKLSVWSEEVLFINLPELVSLAIESFEDEGAPSEMKKAITSTGLMVLVPKFCNVGDRINVSTSDGKYRSR
ncbi:elongation factor P-like [Rattus rattus]|uniref:elongation factor P-like n=1 Tax=Rattus rattus TaxID=10117 RepID=UPI0013F36078|nr:elongation factor P-like [Rattus rattus]